MNIKVHKREVDIDLLPVYVVSSVPDEVLWEEETKIERNKQLGRLQELRLIQALQEVEADEAKESGV